MGHLILVGVVHRDPEGGRHLSQLLQEIRPQAVGLELSPLGLLWREAKGRELLGKLEELLKEFPAPARAHPELKLIAEALRFPFEYLAGVEYTSSQRIPLHLTDLNWISREELPRYENEVLTRENLAALLSMGPISLEEKFEAAYAKASRCLNSGCSLQEVGIRAPWRGKKGLLRELFLACRVRRLADRYHVFVHVGGWVHLVEDPPGFSLASLLRDLQPKRILLRSPGPLGAIPRPSP